MVSFSCENCGDVLTKKKLDPHRNRCRGATFTCIDCMVTFWGTEYRSHTTCMTEEQKTHGALYKPKKARTSATTDTTVGPSTATATPTTSTKMAHAAYVEDVDVNDELGEWRDYEDKSDDDDQSAGDLPPEAPTPPPADEGPLNVFDFLVANATPAASSLSLPQTGRVQLSEDTQLVRFDHEANGILDPFGDMDEDAMVQYGTGPVPTFETPAPKGERKKARHGEKELKTDKKRKRLHVETGDQVMTDAPPVLHTGLTGRLDKLMSRPHAFPPSPDYSGGDMADTPASPLKKTKHSKHTKPSRTETIGSSIMAMISSGSAKPTKVKSKKRKSTTTSGTKKHRHRIEGPKDQKLLEFTSGKDGEKDGEAGSGNQMVVYKPRAEHFLSFVNKGPESERGCSLNKALKRYHRERNASGQGLGKIFEEKELFRSLRLRKNERGEIVLFTV